MIDDRFVGYARSLSGCQGLAFSVVPRLWRHKRLVHAHEQATDSHLNTDFVTQKTFLIAILRWYSIHRTGVHNYDFAQACVNAQVRRFLLKSRCFY